MYIIRFLHLSIHQSIHFSIHSSIHSSVQLSSYPSVHPSVQLSICPFVHPSVHPSISYIQFQMQRSRCYVLIRTMYHRGHQTPSLVMSSIFEAIKIYIIQQFIIIRLIILEIPYHWMEWLS